MGKVKDQDAEYTNLVEQFKVEAAKNAVNAFNEGFLLGKRYAEQVLGDKGDKNAN